MKFSCPSCKHEGSEEEFRVANKYKAHAATSTEVIDAISSLIRQYSKNYACPECGEKKLKKIFTDSEKRKNLIKNLLLGAFYILILYFIFR